MTEYLLKVALIQIAFYALYYPLFRNNTFFKLNRFYILSTLLISFVLPLISFTPTPVTVSANDNMLPEVVVGVGNTINHSLIQASEQVSSYSTSAILYFAIAAIMLLFLMIKISSLVVVIFKSQKEFNPEYTLVKTNKPREVFSWFRYIFSSKNDIEKSIIQHELVHIKQKHSWDLIIVEIIRSLMWFNPIVFLFERELKLIHEFEADAIAAKKYDKDYAMLLLTEAFGVSNLSLVHNFIDVKQLKLRIKMLSKEKSSRIKLLSYLMVVPVILLLGIEYSIAQEKESSDMKTFQAKEIVITALTQADKGKKIEKLNLPKLRDVSTWTNKEQGELINKSIMKHFSKNFKYPEKAKELGIQGRVLVAFNVDNKGKIHDRVLVEGENEDLINEAMRVLSQMKSLDVIYEDGKSIRLNVIVPITFKLQGFYGDQNKKVNASKVELTKNNNFQEDEVFNFQVVENQPIFPGCEDKANKEEKYMCFMID